MRVLIVRLSSLGDVVHTIPVAAAIRRHYPDAVIDWVVGEAASSLLKMVPVINNVFVLRSKKVSTISAWIRLRRELRLCDYDIAFDVQGLIKSALVARFSGATRVIGFSPPFLRESLAKWFYKEEADLGSPVHVVERNLGILTALGIKDKSYEFPLQLEGIRVVDQVYACLGGRKEPFVLLNPNAAWSNKCWPAKSFGAVSAYIRDHYGMRTVVLWNSVSEDDEKRMDLVIESSKGAAVSAPPTTLVELASVIKMGTLLISGDTGPLHIAGALGTPVVGIYGPSNPERNGPWSSRDEVVSASDKCQCLKRYPNKGAVGVVRRCDNPTWCLDDVSVSDVCAAVDRILSGVSADA
mgnify:CR=1 FL=1